ncbi:MAG: pantoate--beta-alanine ligase [Bacteroidota bacterium]
MKNEKINPSMYLFKHVKELKHYLNALRKENAAIGFVPTMGALHEGHLSLVRAAKKDNVKVVVSIFVNPTQFDDTADLAVYPRTAPKDIEMLSSEQTDILFMPNEKEVYPPGLDTTNPFDFGKMATIMEGAHRTGHFDGMAQVVRRLLQIVEPDLLYMGQKDYQQQAIVKKMLKLMGVNTELVMCPIIREPDGLAMSSRNVRLSEEDRKKAALISKTLFEAKKEASLFSLQEMRTRAIEKLSLPGMEVDYFEVADAISLEPIEHFEDAEQIVICTTVRVGGVRLLDNILLVDG